MAFSLGKKSQAEPAAEEAGQHNWKQLLGRREVPEDYGEIRVLGSEDEVAPAEPSAQPTSPAQQQMTLGVEPKAKVIDIGLDTTVPKQPTATNPGQSLEEELRQRFGGAVKSALGPGTVIEGKFRFEEPVCIDGCLNGEVMASSALIVGSQATVDAKIHVGSLIVVGAVAGNVDADDLVEIKAGGKLEGDICAKRLIIEDGGFFEGRCTRKKA